MMSTRGSDHNKRCELRLIEYLMATHEATLRPGFYGKVEVSWQVKDGSIQQDMTVRMEENCRLASLKPPEER